VTDPPYASLDKHRAVGTTTRLAKAWFSTVPNEYFRGFFRECYRVLKPNAHCYVMCDAETMFAIKPMGEDAGFKFWKPIVWDKMKMGMGYHYRARCEFILFFEKGKRKLNSLGIQDVLELEEAAPDILKVPRVAGGQFDDDWRKRRELSGEPYPTEKPVGLSQVLISQSSAEDEIVLDPFCGSASVGHASLSLGRRFVGYDSAEDAVTIGRSRLETVQ
jgi:site-specific DNA-methyltransferase (adenine-specific)